MGQAVKECHCHHRCAYFFSGQNILFLLIVMSFLPFFLPVSHDLHHITKLGNQPQKAQLQSVPTHACGAAAVATCTPLCTVHLTIHQKKPHQYVPPPPRHLQSLVQDQSIVEKYLSDARVQVARAIKERIAIPRSASFKVRAEQDVEGESRGVGVEGKVRLSVGCVVPHDKDLEEQVQNMGGEKCTERGSWANNFTVFKIELHLQQPSKYLLLRTIFPGWRLVHSHPWPARHR
mmetsp:Transcript_25614/g.47741  ORF Transcript_25614/g.47741 Transcript_25614/m.47741 type:complete len:233 (+) Transcript_25614:383-1081(+)